MPTFHTTCASCGGPFRASRPDALTCGPTCRSRRYREHLASDAVKAAADLLHRQTAAIIAYTATDDDVERERLRGELAGIAAEAAERWPAAA